jgi:hypothetical protein
LVYAVVLAAVRTMMIETLALMNLMILINPRDRPSVSTEEVDGRFLDKFVFDPIKPFASL